MPTKPKRPCSYPNCPALVYGRYCKEHEKLIDKHYNKYERNSETKQRYDSTWRKIRKFYINLNPLCEACKARGRFTPAAHVHHIKSITDGGTNDFCNLESLCISCHSRAHAKDGSRWKRK